MWVADINGNHVKTLGRWSGFYWFELLNWLAQVGPQDTDAIVGATRLSHANAVAVTWDMRDKVGTVVPDGTYLVFMELADEQFPVVSDNNCATFAFRCRLSNVVSVCR